MTAPIRPRAVLYPPPARPPAAPKVGDLWEDPGQRRFRILTVGTTHVRVVTVVGRGAGRQSSIALGRLAPGGNYRLISPGHGLFVAPRKRT